MKRFPTLIIALSLATGLLLFSPIFIGAARIADKVETPFDACAAGENGSCCRYDAVCGLNGENYEEYEYYDGSCSDRDRKREEDGE